MSQVNKTNLPALTLYSDIDISLTLIDISLSLIQLDYLALVFVVFRRPQVATGAKYERRYSCRVLYLQPHTACMCMRSCNANEHGKRERQKWRPNQGESASEMAAKNGNLWAV